MFLKILKSKQHPKVAAIILSLFFLFSAQSCKKNPEDYQYCVARIYKTQPAHWGRGYYKLTIFYEFSYDGTLYQQTYKDNRLAKIYAVRFDEGDSVLIKFPREKIHKSTIVKRTYIKSKDGHIGNPWEKVLQ